MKVVMKISGCEPSYLTEREGRSTPPTRLFSDARHLGSEAKARRDAVAPECLPGHTDAIAHECLPDHTTFGGPNREVLHIGAVPAVLATPLGAFGSLEAECLVRSD